MTAALHRTHGASLLLATPLRRHVAEVTGGPLRQCEEAGRLFKARNEFLVATAEPRQAAGCDFQQPLWRVTADRRRCGTGEIEFLYRCATKIYVG